MRILLFGKSGQVARELQRQAEVAVLGRAEADLRDPQACAEAILRSDADAVINAAAYTAVDRAEEEEELATTVNARAPGAMARACADRGMAFLHLSTDYVFDGSGEAPWTENDRPAPKNAYGRSKRRGEEAVLAAGGRAAVLRTSWVFSAHGGNFVKTMLRLAETRGALRIVDDQIGGPTPAAGIAAALLRMAPRLARGLPDRGGAGIYHFSGEPHVSWAEFAAEIFRQAGREVQVIGIPGSEYPTPARRPANSRLDCRKIAQTYGIAPPDWREGLSQVLADLKEPPR